MISTVLTLRTEANQLRYAAEFVKTRSLNEIIYLQGNLGVGKTTFVRGMLRGLGYQGKVKSPTYTLVETYETEAFRLHHYDFYRIRDPEELEFMGIRDYFQQPAIHCIEWPERAKGVIPVADVTLTLSMLQEGRRLSISL